jgi:hypothetical protein
MIAATFWFLITVGGYNGNQVVYSPPLQDLETCQFLQKTTTDLRGYYGGKSQCVQLKTVISK